MELTREQVEKLLQDLPDPSPWRHVREDVLRNDAALRERAEAAERAEHAAMLKIEELESRLTASEHAAYDVAGTIDALKARVRELEFDIAASGIPSQVRTWTTDKPKVAGSWWRRPQKGHEYIVDVYQGNGGLRAEIATGDDRLVSEMEGGEWSGPIPLPKGGGRP